MDAEVRLFDEEYIRLTLAISNKFRFYAAEEF